jgi:hypothetical protein
MSVAKVNPELILIQFQKELSFGFFLLKHVAETEEVKSKKEDERGVDFFYKKDAIKDIIEYKNRKDTLKLAAPH